jgi:hypothetical protein
MYKKIGKIKYCILEQEKDLIEYEKKFYEACIKKGTDLWALENLEIIDGCRLKPFVPYKSLISIGLKIDDELTAGVRVNTDIDNFQLYKSGFTVKKEHGVCEGMNFFALGDDYSPIEFFNVMESFLNDCMSNMKSMNIKKLYATCIDRIKIIYLRAGFKIIESRNIDGEPTHLIMYEF